MKVKDLAQEVTMRFDKRAQIAEPQAQIYEAWSARNRMELMHNGFSAERKREIGQSGEGE